MRYRHEASVRTLRPCRVVSLHKSFDGLICLALLRVPGRRTTFVLEQCKSESRFNHTNHGEATAAGRRPSHRYYSLLALALNKFLNGLFLKFLFAGILVSQTLRRRGKLEEQSQRGFSESLLNVFLI